MSIHGDNCRQYLLYNKAGKNIIDYRKICNKNKMENVLNTEEVIFSDGKIYEGGLPC